MGNKKKCRRLPALLMAVMMVLCNTNLNMIIYGTESIEAVAGSEQTEGSVGAVAGSEQTEESVEAATGSEQTEESVGAVAGPEQTEESVGAAGDSEQTEESEEAAADFEQSEEVKQLIVTVPEETVLSGYAGSTLTLPGIRVSKPAEGMAGKWFCVKDGDTSTRLEVTEQKGELTILLSGSAGDYQLFYVCDDAASNAITITILRIPVEIDWKLLPEQKKIYDATPDFVIELPVLSDAVLCKGAEKKEFAIKPEDHLTIYGKVISAQRGCYDAIEVTEIRDDQDLYDVSGITRKAEGLTDRFEIRQAVLAVDVRNVSMQYRANTIEDPSQIVFTKAGDLTKAGNLTKAEDFTNVGDFTKVGDFANVEDFMNAGDDSTNKDDRDGGIARELLEKMGDVQNITYLEKERKATCTFSNVLYDEERKLAYIGDQEENIRFEFPGLQAYDGKNLLFTVHLVPEHMTLSSGDLERMLRVQQVGTEGPLRNEAWCSDRPVMAVLSKETEYYGEMGYTAVQFRRVGQDAEVSSGISAGEVSEQADHEMEAYYEILLSKGDASWPYTCTAGYIHIIADEWTEQADHGQTMVVSGDIYPVMNLILDTTAPKIRFMDYMQPEDGKILLDGRHMQEIRFELENSGFQTTDLEYLFVEQTDRLSDGYVTEHQVIEELKAAGVSGSMTRFAVSADETVPYTVSCPEMDGDYVLVVRTVNSAGTEGWYCSRGFAVDHTAPEVTAQFFESQQEISADLAGQPYRNQPVSVKLNLAEMHIDEIQIEIKAVNRKGDTLFTTDTKQYEQELSRLTYDSRGGSGTVTIPFTADANYEISVRAKDKAGNVTAETCQFILDRSVPDQGKIQVVGTAGIVKENSTDEKDVLKTVRNSFQKTFEKLYSNVRYCIFGDDTIQYTLSGSDEISPVEISYYISVTELDEEGLKALRENDWLKWDDAVSKPIAINTKCILYERVRDLAGNCSYFSTEGMITDNRKPEITITLGDGVNTNGFYHGDVTFSAKVEDVLPENAVACSGLQYVSYYLKKDGSYQQGEILLEKSGEDASQVSEYEITTRTIPARLFDSNGVVLCIAAVDQAGNRIVEEKEIKIDCVKPQIQVTYDDQPGAQYYNHARTATIRIRERNLDIRDVKLRTEGAEGGRVQISDWSHSGEAGVSDDTIYTCRVTFSGDDQYVFSVACEDLAGNQADQIFSDRFILDTTAPVIAVTYHGTRPELYAYYRTEVTATITITEQHFAAEKADIQVHAENGTAPTVSAFSSSGDVHTATVSWNTDGTFGLDVAYMDEAGNVAEGYKGNLFTVDLTDPVIVIGGVEDHSANKGEVKPVITCQDENYAGDQVSVRLVGSNHGEVESGRFALDPEEVEKGQVFRFDFPKDQDVDDVYTLTVEMTDKAGNRSEKSIEFSVNRYGSVYTLDPETAGWLKNGECAYLQDAKPIVIIETNVDEIRERNIAFTEGGVNSSVATVKEIGDCSQEERERGAYYEVKKTGKAGKWHQYAYTISKENFLSEGRYFIQIDSTDQAGNHTSNVSNRHRGGNVSMEFAVDHTPPSAVVTGAENGALYNEISHMLFLDVQDNFGLREVTVFLNGTPGKTYTAGELSALENGVIPVKVEQSVSKQTVGIVAKDMAGNVLGGKGGGKYDRSFGVFEILVTTNVWIRLIHRTWFRVTALAAAGLLTAVCVSRRRRR